MATQKEASAYTRVQPFVLDEVIISLNITRWSL